MGKTLRMESLLGCGLPSPLPLRFFGGGLWGISPPPRTELAAGYWWPVAGGVCWLKVVSVRPPALPRLVQGWVGAARRKALFAFLRLAEAVGAWAEFVELAASMGLFVRRVCVAREAGRLCKGR